MFFTDYRIQRTFISASNGSRIRTLYTTEYPCLIWIEVLPGELAGFNGEKQCFFDITYTGDATLSYRTSLFGTPSTRTITVNRLESVEQRGTTVGYCPREGVAIRFNTSDDDHSGVVNVHILRLPNSSGVVTDVTV